MSCDQFRENLELYALGALENDEANALKQHLATGCPFCAEALQRAINLNALIARNVPMVDPPPGLRRRIGQSIAPSGAVSGRHWLPWVLAAAALLALAVGLSVQMRLRQTGTQIAQSQLADQARLSSALEILEAPGTRAVSFSDSTRPQLHGALYVHQKLGLALIIDRLPVAPAGWKYVTWIVPKTGAPQLVEPFHPDHRGRAVSVVPGPVKVDELDGVAVSMEPQGARPTKPTQLVFEAKI